MTKDFKSDPKGGISNILTQKIINIISNVMTVKYVVITSQNIRQGDTIRGVFRL